MFFDFSFYLLLAVALLLAVLVGWKVIARRDPGRQTPLLVAYVRELFPILLIVFLLRSFVLEPFRIPSGSMLPNLRDGDLILVTKYDYGIRLPVLNRTLIPVGSPQRGDAVVFYHPEKTNLHYIKRVIGLPGDRILIREGRVYANDEPLDISERPRPQGPAYRDAVNEAVAETRRQTQELMPERFGQLEFRIEADSNGSHWITVHERDALAAGHEIVVPPDHYFVLGDNRNRSNDSRFWGFVPDHHIAGKARFIWMHLSWRFWSRTGSIDPIDPIDPIEPADPPPVSAPAGEEKPPATPEEGL